MDLQAPIPNYLKLCDTLIILWPYGVICRHIFTAIYCMLWLPVTIKYHSQCITGITVNMDMAPLSHTS